MIDFQRAYDEAVRQSNDSILEAERNVMSERLSIWSQGLDMVGGVWGRMTDIVTNSYGKQSAAARAFFFVQKTIAAAQAVVNTEEAATKALAQGGALFGIPMATLVRALVMLRLVLSWVKASQGQWVKALAQAVTLATWV